ncbi:MAG: nicotinate (nicotinamide) nucleotide adenylyltransferase [Bacteroidales bacterium]|jgi:nicotinate-nucleotide adenylyltransferase|nr:nicotinate (nicotinamide) nucleotide adenylyltransferase [Bacteroidales bacterium]MDD2617625.1 nicotinate (nicotinamide) nucleotide adenylyltransferase [Bacteroidales bacterium]MDD4641148.1 nicotinate (nicotinamide) nucleotide adenylyltransferase [Bacteroidales bacterium]
MKRIGIFGGTFDPIHYGHISVAEHALRQAGLDELWFVISPHNPLKKEEEIKEAGQRLQEARQALSEFPEFIVSDIEFDLPRPSYMAQTLRTLQNKYPGEEFVLIIGGDNLAVFEQWKDYRFLLDHFDILVYPRPGSPNRVPDTWTRVNLLDAPPMDVSSTQIRKAQQRRK